MRRHFDVPELPLEPPDPEPVARCACCGDEIYATEPVYRVGCEDIHRDCLRDYVAASVTDTALACALGYREGFAGCDRYE